MSSKVQSVKGFSLKMEDCLCSLSYCLFNQKIKQVSLASEITDIGDISLKRWCFTIQLADQGIISSYRLGVMCYRMIVVVGVLLILESNR